MNIIGENVCPGTFKKPEADGGIRITNIKLLNRVDTKLIIPWYC